MAELSIFLPQPLAAAIRGTVDTYARMAKEDGDRRPLGQLRVGVLGDLVLRPGETSRPPVTAHLTVVAPAGTVARGSAGHDACSVGHLAPDANVPAAADAAGLGSGVSGCGYGEPAEVDGQPITAAQLRELLEQLDSLCPGGLQAPAGGSLNVALVDPLSGALRASITRRELSRLARRGCLDHPAGGCQCAMVQRPPPVDRYEHTPAQQRFVKTRDRTCRHPGCRNDAAWADLDHVVPHARGGATTCENLCCLCRRQHRLKTHAAPGWRFEMDSDGVLTVTTPSGVTRVTRPPGLRAPDDAPPPF